ncbi:hypothetical protein [Metabacillus malikii]|uniref:Swarming motility protein SwrB n=1 Tax=Metabacillus malikii TaxID=1504265 RepID=A0ABT9ZE35_9BACI|nr:hypothetical protein [Metabacillus malikii]MDQ0230507.1 hypothetical protein [Metabacillus malikii]
MNTFLFMISLLLHIVAFYFIVVLFTRYSAMKNVAETQSTMLEEAENSLTNFLIEMKDENNRLIQQLTSNSAASVQENSSEHVGKHSKNTDEKNSELELDSNNGANDLLDLPNYLQDLSDIKDVVEIKTEQVEDKPLPFEKKVIDLYEKGYSIEKIAKQLNKGKTEIELLLKFQQKH